MPTPSIGRIVHYTLADYDVDAIRGLEARMNRVNVGDVYPAIVVRTFGGDAANLKVLLDGGPGAEYWATSRQEGNEGGRWHWPERKES